MLQIAATTASTMPSDTMITAATTTPTVCGASLAPHSHTHSHLCDFSAQPDTDSDVDIYGQRYPPASSESLGPRVGLSDTTATAYAEYAGPPGAREPYPAWSAERQIPLSKEEIEDIFLDLTQKFGFQRDSMRNMVTFIHKKKTSPY
jgi:hypothetical protein